jgi:hypothetical protein
MSWNVEVQGEDYPEMMAVELDEIKVVDVSVREGAGCAALRTRTPAFCTRTPAHPRPPSSASETFKDPLFAILRALRLQLFVRY